MKYIVFYLKIKIFCVIIIEFIGKNFKFNFVEKPCFVRKQI